MGSHQTIRVMFSSLAAVTLIMLIVMYIHIDDSTRTQAHIRLHKKAAQGNCLDCDISSRKHHTHKPYLIDRGHEDHHHDHDVHQVLSDRDKNDGRLNGVFETSVAIGLGITTRGQEGLQEGRVPTELPFFRRLLLSFCHTCSRGYQYHFYIAHDHNDPFFHYNSSHALFTDYYFDFVERNCPSYVNVSLHLHECAHAGNPAWAQNDAMMAAYMDDIAYYYRVNDDTIFETTSWTEHLIETLLRYDPPNVGVVGPWFRDGNIAILTHDFVHRSHVDIFGFYYPRVFTDWFADDWITGVYWPERCKKVPGVRVKHTMEMGSRYVVRFEKANRVAMEVEIGKTMLKRFLMGMDKNFKASWPKDSKNVVAMSIYGDHPDVTFGILRYSQLLPVMMKGWRMRVYVEDQSTGSTVYPAIPKLLLRKLGVMGVEIIHIDRDTASELMPDMWKLLVADDLAVERFLLRHPYSRPTEREEAAINEWLKLSKAFMCIRDNPEHAHHPVIPHLVGGMPQILRNVLGKSWRALMRGYTSDFQFLEDVVWPSVVANAVCFDSVSCKTWPSAKPYPVLRNDNEFVGAIFDENDQAALTDTRSWNATYNLPDCVFLENTGFSQKAVRTVIGVRPVLWSQDYHVTPVMDMKSLLSPIGVKIIDKSLSYYCGQVGTCARGLRVITRENGMRLTPQLIDQFYESYKDDPEMKSVTAFVCTLPTAMCEAFLPFNKSIIVISNIRYEQGRPEPDKWKILNENLIHIAESPNGIVAANNLYDAKYIEYFTGISPMVVPNHCRYLRDTYTPSRKQFLVTPIHSTELTDKFYMEFDEVLMKKRAEIIALPLRQMYPQYLFSDLASHPGIIYIPYQISMSSLTEQYRMNIPMFFPSLKLLSTWHLEYQVVRQRTWAAYMLKKARKSNIKGVRNWPDPNNDEDEDAIRHWLQFADFYQWPHFVYYNSIDDLVDKLIHTNLTQVSHNMKQYNKQARQHIQDSWSQILLKVLH